MDVNSIKRKRPVPLASIVFQGGFSPPKQTPMSPGGFDSNLQSPLSNSISSPSLLMSPSQQSLLFNFSPENSERKRFIFKSPESSIVNRRKSILRPPKRPSLMVANTHSVTINAPETASSDRGGPRANSMVSRLRQSVMRIEASNKAAKAHEKRRNSKVKISIRETQLKLRNSMFRAVLQNQFGGASQESSRSTKLSYRLKLQEENIAPKYETEDEDDNPSPLFRSQYELQCPTYEMFEPHSTSSSNSESSDEEISPKRRRIRFRLKKVFYAVYYIGVMLYFKNKVKVYGAVRPLFYIEEFEKLKPAIENRENKIFPLHPITNFTAFWTFTIVTLLLAAAILTPLYISFASDDDVAFTFLNDIFDICFALDIILNFLTAYVDIDRRIVWDQKKIAKRYLQSWFTVDLIAVLPFETISSWIFIAYHSSDQTSQLFRLFRIPRLIRLLKIFRLVKILKIFSISQAAPKIVKELSLNVNVTRILKIFLSFVFLNHIVGCLWFFVAKLEDLTPDTWVGQAGLIDADAAAQYVAAVYWSFTTITTVGMADIQAGTDLEYTLLCIWMICGVLFYSFVVGILSSTLSNFDKKNQDLVDKIEAFKGFARHADIPQFLRQKIQRYFEINHKEEMLHWIDPNSVVKALPMNLRTKVLLFSYYELIKNILILQIDATFTASLLLHAKLLKLKPNEILYRQDDLANEIYFISKGSIKFTTEYAQDIYSLSEGTLFGEVEVIHKTKRLCFCQALTPTVLIVIPKAPFLRALEDFPKMEEQINRIATLRKDRIEEKHERIMREGDTTENLESHRSIKKQPVLLRKTEYIFNLLLVKTDEELLLKEIEREKKRKLNLVRPVPKPGIFSNIKEKILDIARRLTSKADVPIRKVKTAQSTVFRKTLHTPTCPSPDLPSTIKLSDLPDSTITTEELSEQQREELEYGIRSNITSQPKIKKKKSTILQSSKKLASDAKEKSMSDQSSVMKGLVDGSISSRSINHGFQIKLTEVETSSAKGRRPKFEELLDQIEIPMDSARVSGQNTPVRLRDRIESERETNASFNNGTPESNLVQVEFSPPVSPQKKQIVLKKVSFFDKNLLSSVRRKDVYNVSTNNKLNPIMETRESMKGDSPISRGKKKTSEGFSTLGGGDSSP